MERGRVTWIRWGLSGTAVGVALGLLLGPLFAGTHDFTTYQETVSYSQRVLVQILASAAIAGCLMGLFLAALVCALRSKPSRSVPPVSSLPEGVVWPPPPVRPT